MTEETAMAKQFNPLEDLSWIHNCSFEELAAIKKEVLEKMEAEKHMVRDQLAHELKTKLSLYGFSLAELGMAAPAPSQTPSKGPRKPREPRPEGEGPKRVANTSRPCPICKFFTEPHHDGRHHRSQVPKAAYTDADLEANHMRRVDAPVEA